MPSFLSRVRSALSHFSAATLLLHITFGSLIATMPVYVEKTLASHSTDLSITKVADDATINIGDTITYTITVVNAGGSHTDHVDDVTVTDVLPAGLTYVSHTDDDAFTTCTYTSGTTTLSCSVATDADGKMHKGETVVITLVATAAGCGGISNTATVSEADASISESNTANNSDTELVTASNCGTITIVKDAVPNDVQNFGFTGDLGTFTLDDDADGTLPNSTVFTRVAGTYAVTEDATALWELTGIDCGADVGSSTNVSTRTATIDLDSGETITCTFTNEQDTTATITIVKQTVPDGADGEFDFEGEGFGEGSDLENAFSLSDGDSATDTEVEPGEGYSVTETIPEGWTLTNIDCEGEGATVDLPNETVDFDVAAGDDVTCTFTNTQYGTLRINKDAVGGDDEFDFTIDEEGGDGLFETSITTTEGEGFVDVSVPAGDYAVTETLPSGEDWILDENGCAFPVVSPGQTTNCTVTNIKKSTIQVIKQTVSGFGGFHFQGTVDGEDDDIGGEDGFDLTTSEGNNPVDTFFDVFVDVEGDSVSLAESQNSSDGWTLTSTQCLVDGGNEGESEGGAYNFTLDPGETAVCTFINTLAVCGNSDIEETEQCDDGDVDGEDGCSSTCQIESGYACTSEPSECTTNCGDGVTAGSEQCDDDGNVNGDGCTEFCVLEFCGDSVVNNVSETCDDGDADGGDGCDASCILEEGWSCPTPGSACSEVCGDGTIVGDEECDDGESDGGDGCSSSCEVESGYLCEEEPSQCTLQLDFGDAPDPEGEGYPTLLSNDGARHIIIPGIRLGESIDAETDGQPNSDATGDDGEGDDDEDGVTFNEALIAGTTADITVDASTGDGESDYFLDAWFDWNQDEDWDDEGERVLSAEPLSDGENAFEVPIPSDAVLGNTFARFRMSDEEGEGVGTTGLEDVGEVEDYEVTISEQSSSSSSSESSSSDTSSSSSSSSDDPNDGPGASRGSDTNRYGSAIRTFATANNWDGSTALPGFGGTETDPLSPEQRAFIEWLIRLLGCDVSNPVLRFAAGASSPFSGVEPGVIVAQFRAMCAEQEAQSNVPRVAYAVPPRPIVLDAEGYPLTANPVLRECVRRDGLVSLDIIRNNPETVTYRNPHVTVHYPKTCGQYRQAGSKNWFYPDYGLWISVNPVRGGKPIVKVPRGYAAVPSPVITVSK